MMIVGKAVKFGGGCSMEQMIWNNNDLTGDTFLVNMLQIIV